MKDLSYQKLPKVTKSYQKLPKVTNHKLREWPAVRTIRADKKSYVSSLITVLISTSSSNHTIYSTVLKSVSLQYCTASTAPTLEFAVFPIYSAPATTTPPAVRVTTPCTSGISNRQVVSACPTSSSRVGGTPYTCLSASLPPCVVGNNTFLLLDPLLFTVQYWVVPCTFTYSTLSYQYGFECSSLWVSEHFSCARTRAAQRPNTNTPPPRKLSFFFRYNRHRWSGSTPHACPLPPTRP